ncbi:MAG: prolyl oligopeptidase family serine peptidase [Rubripirellula sp.]|nr:prolyl oligopeptidase family serine peptidase [Rubripirellula sp.]
MRITDAMVLICLVAAACFGVANDSFSAQDVTQAPGNREQPAAAKLHVQLVCQVRPLNRQRVSIRSSVDGTEQPAILILPPVHRAGDSEKVPLVINLHSWSADFNQRTPLEQLVTDQGWIFLAPNFRGPNSQPEACGSLLAQQDILDAVQWAIDRHDADSDRVYLTGSSGGGHMTLLMVARHPQVWKAASAWVGISDLAAWHKRHRGARYGNMLEACCQGSPGESIEIDKQYAARSPLTFLGAAQKVPVDIAAGIQDGHQGSVPVAHSIWAFNAIAKATGTPLVSQQEITLISEPAGRLESPQPSDEGFDEAFGRQHYLRRRSGAARLTIFEGGHEGIPGAVIEWFQSHL